MPSKLIVVLGATGLQGGSVARLFASKPGWRVRGITRNPDKPSNAALRDSGIELVAGDFDDPASLDKAFEGANVIFANTDFWQLVSNPATHATAAETGQLPNAVAYDREVQQGKNVVDMAAKHASHLDVFIWSTLSDTKKWSKGEFIHNLHFDSKAAVADHIKDSHSSLAAKTSYLQVGMYLQNWQGNAALRPQKRLDGTFTIDMPRSWQTNLAPLVDPSNDTGLFVEALVNAPAGSKMLGFCKQMPYGEFWRLWARVHDVKLEIQEREMEFAGMPEWLQQEFEEAFAYVIKYGFTGGEEGVKAPGELGVDVSKLTNLEEWIRKEDFSSIL